MIACPPVNCRTEVIDKKLFINSVKLRDNDIPFKIKTKVMKCEAKDSEPTYRYKCEENAIDVKIKNLLNKEEKLPDVKVTNNNIDFPNFIGQL